MNFESHCHRHVLVKVREVGIINFFYVHSAIHNTWEDSKV